MTADIGAFHPLGRLDPLRGKVVEVATEIVLIRRLRVRRGAFVDHQELDIAPEKGFQNALAAG